MDLVVAHEHAVALVEAAQLRPRHNGGEREVEQQTLRTQQQPAGRLERVPRPEREQLEAGPQAAQQLQLLAREDLHVYRIVGQRTRERQQTLAGSWEHVQEEAGEQDEVIIAHARGKQRRIQTHHYGLVHE